jgi:ABC-type antimicrobial peptide transport system permease subunit
MIRTAGTRRWRDLRRAVSRSAAVHSGYRRAAIADRAILQERVTAILGGFFGALALALAAIGLYGLMAFGVERRRKEIAIRVALGSARSDVIRMVVRDALSLVVAGLAIGVPLALLSSRLVARLLFGLAPTDPVTLVVTAALLLAIGAIGGYIPGRRRHGRSDRALRT